MEIKTNFKNQYFLDQIKFNIKHNAHKTTPHEVYLKEKEKEPKPSWSKKHNAFHLFQNQNFFIKKKGMKRLHTWSGLPLITLFRILLVIVDSDIIILDWFPTATKTTHNTTKFLSYFSSLHGRNWKFATFFAAKCEKETQPTSETRPTSQKSK